MQEQAHKLGNYVVTSNNGKLTINPAPLTVTAADANRLYGDPNPAFTGTITGIKNADNITATYASAATVASPVGTYAIVPALVDPDHKLGNYVVTSNDGKLTVNPAPLTVTAADAGRLYGDPNPSFTGTITGIKNSDNITATYASAATPASAIGTYPIVPTLVDLDHKLGNYVVTSNEVDEQQHVGELGPVPWATDVLTHFVSPRQPEAVSVARDSNARSSALTSVSL